MSVSKRLAIIFVRPIYRAFFEKPLWWFLSRVKAYFFAEVGVQLGNIERFLGQDRESQRWMAVEERLRTLEANNAAQWAALEQLLLALFRQAELRRTERVEEPMGDDSQNGQLTQVHTAGSLR